jgi:TonB family protein
VSVLLRTMALGLLTAIGCATTLPGIEEADVEGLHGTWRWMSSDQAGPKGQLLLGADGNYMLTERKPGQTSSIRGTFRVYRVADQDSLDPWLELEHAGNRQERVFQFLGRDTLLLRDGISGSAVIDSEVDLFVRAPLGKPWESATGIHGASEESPPYDREPVPIRAPNPRYPEFARDAGITGKVVLHVLIDEGGRVQEVEIVQSIPGLDQAAVEAVKGWTFEPALKAGLPVAAWFEVPIDFRL